MILGPKTTCFGGVIPEQEELVVEEAGKTNFCFLCTGDPVGVITTTMSVLIMGGGSGASSITAVVVFVSDSS